MTIHSTTTSYKIALSLGAAIVAGVVFAQGPPPAVPRPAVPRPAAPAPPAVPASLHDVQQLRVYKGQVQQFTLTPHGDIDGLILTDGTEVKTPPHLSTELAYLVHPGDRVTIHGLRASGLPLIQARSITNQANGQTVTDSGPGRRAFHPMEVQGRVRMSLHGPRGEVNGVLLDNGTVLRLPPHEASRFAEFIKPGQTLFAEGNGVSNALGRVIEVNRIGPSKDRLTAVDVPPKRARKEPRPPSPMGPGLGLPPKP